MISSVKDIVVFLDLKVLEKPQLKKPAYCESSIDLRRYIKRNLKIIFISLSFSLFSNVHLDAFTKTIYLQLRHFCQDIVNIFNKTFRCTKLLFHLCTAKKHFKIM